MSAPLWGEEVVWALAKWAIGFFTWASLFILQPLFYISSWIGPVLQGTKLNSKGTHFPISHSLWRYRQTEMDDYNAMWRQGDRDRPGNDRGRAATRAGWPPDGQWQGPPCFPPAHTRSVFKSSSSPQYSRLLRTSSVSIQFLFSSKCSNYETFQACIKILRMISWKLRGGFVWQLGA